MTALEKIKEYIDGNDTDEKVSQAELAKIVGVSRQRIAQLVEINDLGHVVKTRENNQRKCIVCDQDMDHDKFGRYCSDECKLLLRKQNFYVTLKCATCGGEFSIRKSEYKARLRNKQTEDFFCSKKCQGSSVGKKYGFGNRN
jgi:predicted nucleic acid-binding Zn ribbon protein